ncbi:MAG: cupin domain-containing protein [Candidatus Thorarchaeota archaeon]
MGSRDIFEEMEFADGRPVKAKLVERASYTVMRLTLKKGTTVPPHPGSHSAFFLVLRGRAVVTHGAGEVELGPNQYILIEPNEDRGFHAKEDSVILAVRE